MKLIVPGYTDAMRLLELLSVPFRQPRYLVGFDASNGRFLVGKARSEWGRDRLERRAANIVAEQGLTGVVVKDLRTVAIARS
jgi:hypothetical protein